jgi:Domain of unknown function (DUF5679)
MPSLSVQAAIVQHHHLGGIVTMAKAPATATGYCMKCKTQREIKNAKPITMKNGRPATEGTCPVCSTKMFKIGASKSSPACASRPPRLSGPSPSAGIIEFHAAVQIRRNRVARHA